MENQAQKGYVFRRLCQQGTLDLVRQMLEAGADVDNAQDDACTGLWLAAEAGCVDVVRLLCGHRASTNIFKNPGNISALFIAAQNGHGAVVDVLLLNGANPNTPKTTGASPIFIASQQNFPGVVKSLLRAGANYGAATSNGMAAIHVAAYQGNTEVIKLLLAAGADPFIPCQGRTAVEWATTNGHRVEVQRCIDSHLKSLEGELSKRKVDAFSAGDKSLSGVGATVGGATDTTPPPIKGSINNTSSSIHSPGAGIGGPPEATGRYLVAAPDTLNSWYTPEFLVKGGGSMGSGGNNNTSYFTSGNQQSQMVTNVSVEGFGTHSRSLARGSSLGGASPDRYSDSRSRGNRAVLRHVPHHTGLSLDTIEEEKKRGENFRKMNKQGNHTAQKAREILENGSSTLGSNPIALISVEQEWDTYRAQLEASEDYLAGTAGDVNDAWMYSAGATQRYSNRMKETHKKMAEAHVYNNEQEQQSKRSQDNPGFTYPRLPPDAVEKLKGFMSTGRGAAGPPPPLAPEEISEEERQLMNYKEPRQYFAIGGWQPEASPSPASPSSPAAASPTAGDAPKKASALSRLKNRKKD